MSNETKPGRLVALDYLRGYFILVIIIDHLYRWPNALSLFTGQGALWFNAADGFVIVSGLMIGYIRGYKGLKLPFRTIALKVWSRAFLLYLWLIISTLAYTGLAWLNPSVPNLPFVPIATGDWGALLTQTITMQFSYVWINFLYLYAVFLALAPAAIWLLRQRLAWIVAIVSIGGLLIGDNENIKWLQWQALFFLPVIAGFYLEKIQGWWSNHPRGRIAAASMAYFATSSIIIASFLFMFVLPESSTVSTVNQYFDKGHLELGSIAISLLAFCGFVLLFIRLQSFIKRYFHWLLMPFGTRSLTVYIVHGLIIFAIYYAIPTSESIVINTLVGIIAVIGSLLLIKIPWVTRFIPR